MDARTPAKPVKDEWVTLNPTPGESEWVTVAQPSAPPTPQEAAGALGFLWNVPKSVAGLFAPLLHPYEAVTGLGKTAIGVIQAMTPETPEGPPKTYAPYARAAVDVLKDRYGGWENLKRTAYEDPVGMVADLSAVLSGGAGLARGVSGAARVAGRPLLAADVAGTARTLRLASEYTNPLEYMARAGKYVAEKGGRVASEAGGLLTGAGGEALRTAYLSPTPELKAAMRGRITEMDIVSDFRDALDNARRARGDHYRQQLAAISAPGATRLDLSAVQQKLDQLLPRFGVKEVPPLPVQAVGESASDFFDRVQRYNRTYAGLQPGDLEFTRSTIHNPSDQARVKALVRDIRGWGGQADDLTPLGVDTLKRRIDDFYSESSQARALVASMKDSVKGVLASVPGYQQMTKDYAVASDFIERVTRELSLGETANPGTAIRKLTYALKQNNEYRRLLTEALEEHTSVPLKSELAGYHLSKTAPRGVMGPLSGFGILYSVWNHLLSPAYAATIALSSPRVMGELLVAMSAARKPSGAIGRLAIDPALYRSLDLQLPIHERATAQPIPRPPE